MEHTVDLSQGRTTSILVWHVESQLHQYFQLNIWQVCLVIDFIWLFLNYLISKCIYWMCMCARSVSNWWDRDTNMQKKKKIQEKGKKKKKSIHKICSLLMEMISVVFLFFYVMKFSIINHMRVKFISVVLFYVQSNICFAFIFTFFVWCFGEFDMWISHDTIVQIYVSEGIHGITEALKLQSVEANQYLFN